MDWNNGELAQGLACYNEQQFFEAHEHWEATWNRLAGDEKQLVQALIQLTVSLHHEGSGNRPGARSLSDRAMRRLEGLSSSLGGVDVASLRGEIRSWQARLSSEFSGSSIPFPRIRIVH